MNLYLIGYRGSGKSTVAPLLAQRLDWDWIDTDAEIESLSGCSIREIFERDGEAGFRRLEAETIRRVASGDSNRVVSLGGGAPLSEPNAQWMRQSGKTVWLRATVDTLWDRIGGDPNSTDRRPRLTTGGRDEVVQLLAIREPRYAACADWQISVDQKSAIETADQICRWWRQNQ